jgi:hypothetical protein
VDCWVVFVAGLFDLVSAMGGDADFPSFDLADCATWLSAIPVPMDLGIMLADEEIL